MSRARHMGRGHEDTRYDGRPPMTHSGGHSLHPIHHKRASGGGIGDDEKMPKEEVYSGGDSGTMREAKKRKRGGGMHVSGAAAKHGRLDRRGRKSGGAVGADSRPMTEASKLTPAGKGMSAE